MTTADRDKNSADFEIEKAVLAFLGRHPQAADTLEGIADWWLPQQRYVTAKARIEAVLRQLVIQGALRMRHLPDGTAIYTRNDERE